MRSILNLLKLVANLSSSERNRHTTEIDSHQSLVEVVVVVLIVSIFDTIFDSTLDSPLEAALGVDELRESVL